MEPVKNKEEALDIKVQNFLDNDKAIQATNDLLKKVSALLDKMDLNPVETADNDINVNNFKFVLPDIKVLATQCRTAKIYQENTIRIKGAIEHIKSDSKSPAECVKSAWFHFLTKSADSPTKLHTISTTIFWLPIMDTLLDEYFKTLN